MKTAIGTMALLAVGFGAPAFAESHVTESVYTDSSFCTSDYNPATDGDQEEQSKAEFATMDLDSDGMVSQAEYIECRKAAAGDTSSMSSPGDKEGTMNSESDSSSTNGSDSMDSDSSGEASESSN